MVRSTVRYVKEKVLVLRKTLNAAPHLDSTNQEARCLERVAREREHGTVL